MKKIKKNHQNIILFFCEMQTKEELRVHLKTGFATPLFKLTEEETKEKYQKWKKV